MWYALQGENGLIALSPEQVKKIVDLNKEGTIPKDLKAYTYVVEKEIEIGYENVVGQDSISRFANTNKNKNKNRNKNRNKNKTAPQQPS